MLLSISQAAEEEIASLIAQWNADTSYLRLWESYLVSLEVLATSDRQEMVGPEMVGIIT